MAINPLQVIGYFLPITDFINSLGSISKGKDAELLCKLKAKNKKLEEGNKQLTANYNEAMISLLKESVVSMEKEKGGHLLRINMLECDVDSVHLREQDC